MSEDTPEYPKIPPPPGHGAGRSQQPRGGNLGLGVVLGALALYAIYLGGTVFSVGAPSAWPSSILSGWAVFIPIALYLALAILLAVRRHTSRFGAGLLIGLGIFTLLGGGLCIGSLAQGGA